MKNKTTLSDEIRNILSFVERFKNNKMVDETIEMYTSNSDNHEKMHEGMQNIEAFSKEYDIATSVGFALLTMERINNKAMEQVANTMENLNGKYKELAEGFDRVDKLHSDLYFQRALLNDFIYQNGLDDKLEKYMLEKIEHENIKHYHKAAKNFYDDVFYYHSDDTGMYAHETGEKWLHEKFGYDKEYDPTVKK